MGEQVGIGATESRGAELIVYVHHQVVVGRQAHQIMQPGSPTVAGILHEARLHTHHAPLTQQGEEFASLPHQRMLVHVEPYPHASLLAVGNHTRQVEFIDHLCSIAVVAGAGHIPLPVEKHIGYLVLGTEVDDLEARLGGYVCPHNLARLHPLGRIGHLTGGVEIEYDIVVLNEFSRCVGHHHHLPRCSTVGDHIHRAIHHAAQRISITL